MNPKKESPAGSGRGSEKHGTDNYPVSGNGPMVNMPSADELLARLARVPEVMRRSPHWVGWKMIHKDGQAKPTKQPRQPRNPSWGADCTKLSHCGSIEDAVAAVVQGLLVGVGFVLTDTPYCGVDLDNAFGQDGELLPWAAEIVDCFRSSAFIETSPSGNGLHLVVTGNLPADAWHKVRPVAKDDPGIIEVYDTGRYFTVTGRVFEDCAQICDGQAALDWLQARFTRKKAEPESKACHRKHDDQSVIERARTAKNGLLFDALMRGDMSAYDDDHSAADAALCAILAFWTRDDVQIDRIFRQSKLMRQKWDERHGPATYGAITIQKALELVAESVESDRNRGTALQAGGGNAEWPDPAPLEYKPRVVPMFDPEILLPDAIKDWVVDEASRMPGPVEFTSVAAIVALGALIGTRCGIRPKKKDDWFELPNVWGAVIGCPSVKKTPGLSAGVSMSLRLATEESERFDREQKAFQDIMEVGELEKAAFKKKLGKAVKARVDGKDAPDEQAHAHSIKEINARLLEAAPQRRRYHTTDATCAKLGDLLVNNPLGLLVFRDELGGLLSKLDHPDNTEERCFYLEGYGGKSSYAIDRVGRGELYVPRVCLSVLGGIQPDRLSGYMNRAFRQAGNDGLIQRFGLLVYPEPTAWEYVDRYPNKVAKDRAWSVFQALNNFDPVAWGAMPSDDFCQFCRFSFSGGAQQLFVEWLDWLQNDVLAKEENPNLEEHFTKYQKLVPALALIFHLVECADRGQRGPVEKQSMARAAAWSELLIEHARKAYGLLIDAGLSGAVALSKKILAAKVQSGFSARDVQRNQWSGLTDLETVKEAIDVLVNEGWLRSVPIQTAGRKKDAFDINPKLVGGAL